MDDYPRSPIPSETEYHVDLFSWIVKATSVMGRLESVLESYYAVSSTNSEKNKNSERNSEKSESDGRGMVRHKFDKKFQLLSEDLLSRLDSLHWSKVHKGKKR